MFWDNFDRLCKINGTNANAVAKELGIASGTVSNWKKSGKLPNGENLVSLASFFDVSVDYLLFGKDLPNTLTDIEQEAVRLLRELSSDKQKYALGRLEEIAHGGSVAADPNLKQAK